MTLPSGFLSPSSGSTFTISYASAVPSVQHHIPSRLPQSVAERCSSGAPLWLEQLRRGEEWSRLWKRNITSVRNLQSACTYYIFVQSRHGYTAWYWAMARCASVAAAFPPLHASGEGRDLRRKIAETSPSCGVKFMGWWWLVVDDDGIWWLVVHQDAAQHLAWFIKWSPGSKEFIRIPAEIVLYSHKMPQVT